MRIASFLNSARFVPYVLLLPIIVYYGVFWLYPFASNIVFSFMEYHFIKPSHFIGFANYRSLFHDADFYKGLKNSLYYTLTLPMSLIPAFLVALLVNGITRGRSFFKASYFATHVISLFALALIMKFLFADNNGIVNGLLTHILHIENVPWMTDKRYMFWVIVLTISYKGVGWNMVVYLAGLQNIDRSLYESAKIDGAGWWVAMTRITIPIMKPVIVFTVTLAFIYVFQLFNPIVLIASRGQFTNIMVDVKTPSVDAYIYAFALDRVGYGSAMMIVMALVVLLFSVLFFKMTSEQSE